VDTVVTRDQGWTLLSQGARVDTVVTRVPGKDRVVTRGPWIDTLVTRDGFCGHKGYRVG